MSMNMMHDSRPLAVLNDVDEIKKIEFLRKCIYRVCDPATVPFTDLLKFFPDFDEAYILMCFNEVHKETESYVTDTKDGIDKTLLQILEVESEVVKKGFKEQFLASKEKLLDFDWKANLVLESNSISNLNEPLVTLSFRIKGKKDVIVECNEDELDSLIYELEKAKSEAQALF